MSRLNTARSSVHRERERGERLDGERTWGTWPILVTKSLKATSRGSTAWGGNLSKEQR